MIIMPNIFKDMRADVRVRVRSSVVAVKVERTVALVLVVVTANEHHNTTRDVEAAIAYISVIICIIFNFRWI